MNDIVNKYAKSVSVSILFIYLLYNSYTKE